MLTINKNEFMFEQKYRPGTIEECILPARDKEIFQALIKKGQIPHLILQSNSPGTGKTTVAKAYVMTLMLRCCLSTVLIVKSTLSVTN